jgi:folate-binding protein YgfZ
MNELTRVQLTHLSSIHLEGTDTLKFLQGQCTQDVQNLEPGDVTAGAFCTAKGRTVANVYLILLDVQTQSVLMLCERSAVPLLFAHLKKYAAFFRTMKMTDCSDSHEMVGLLSPESLTREDLNGLSLEKTIFHWDDDRAIIWHAKQSANDAPWQELTESDVNQWQAKDILSQRLWLDESQSGEWIPQNVSLDDLDGISFKKGCYTGQEVVARLHFKGQSKKRLFGVKAAEGTLALGTKLYADGKDVGVVIQTCQWQGYSYALVVLKTTATESNLFQDENQQVAIELLH